MKFNWGTGIALFYATFVMAFAFLVFKSTQYDHSLVSDEYYADDIAYQEHYDKLANTQQLARDVVVVLNGSKTAIELKFPDGIKDVEGEIVFFRPSDSRKDFRVPVRPDPANEQVVSTQGLEAGLWRVKIDWKAEGKAYYKEELIVI